MRINKIRGNYRITVAKWSNEVVITDKTSGAIIKATKFDDHIKAVMVAKSL